MPSEFRLLPPQPDFENASFWEIMASEEKKEENQEFNYQNPITENPEIETLNIQTQQTPNNLNLNLLVTLKDATSHNLETKQKQPLTNNIPSATITEDESFTIIFPFELKEPVKMPLFSEATLKEKLITAMYTDAKVDGHFIKLILDNRSAGSIIIRQLIDQLGH
ncbi:hypothetical protein G9A89_013930 [Geosiphon pyriformis]|nr:hypothetical protein G9A89_013930 [Geosiphon pyriformis]